MRNKQETLKATLSETIAWAMNDNKATNIAFSFNGGSIFVDIECHELHSNTVLVKEKIHYFSDIDSLLNNHVASEIDKIQEAMKII